MLVVSAGVLASRVLGFVRDIVFAYVWGTGLGMAVWVAAFRIPNLTRALFGEGSFTSAFVPVFSETLEREGKESAWRAACRVVSVLAVVLGGIVLFTALVCGGLLFVLPPKPLYRETLLLTPLFMPYAFLICVAVALGGILNSFRRFAVPALTPLILNMFLILAALAVWLRFGTGGGVAGIWLLVPAVLMAGILHVWLHLRSAQQVAGAPFRFDPDVRAPEVRKVGGLMAPSLVGTGLIQFNIVLDTVWASILGEAALTSLYYSQRLIYLPVGLFGVASSVVALPSLSSAWSRGDRDEFLAQLSHSLRGVLFMCLPMTVLMMVLADPLIRLFFERGSFGESSVWETFFALIFYLPGIPFFSLVKPMAAGFYARQDTRTPVRVAWACLALNVALNLCLMWTLRQGGLALSTTLCSLVNFSALLWLFRKQTGMDVLQETLPSLKRTLLASVAAAAAAFLTLLLLPHMVYASGFRLKLLMVAVPFAAGYGAFGIAAYFLRCPELAELTHGVGGRLRRFLPGGR